MDAQAVKNIADGVPAFQGLDLTRTQRLIGIGRPRTYGRGAILCREGDDSRQLFILLSGTLAVSGVGVELSIIEAPDVVGEMSLLTGLPRSATVEVRAEAEVLEIGQAPLLALLQTDAGMATTVYRNIIDSLCTRLREANEEVLRAMLQV